MGNNTRRESWPMPDQLLAGCSSGLVQPFHHFWGFPKTSVFKDKARSRSQYSAWSCWSWRSPRKPRFIRLHLITFWLKPKPPRQFSENFIKSLKTHTILSVTIYSICISSKLALLLLRACQKISIPGICMASYVTKAKELTLINVRFVSLWVFAFQDVACAFFFHSICGQMLSNAKGLNFLQRNLYSKGSRNFKWPTVRQIFKI